MGEVDLRRACEAVWVAGQAEAWSTLAVVPAPGGPPAVAFARELARVGSEYYGRLVEFVDGTGLGLGAARPMVDRLEGCTQTHSLVVALDDPLMSQASLLVARATHRVVLAVALGQSKLLASRSLMDTLGRHRFLGAVVSA